MAPLCRSRDHGSRHAKPTRPGLQVDTQCSRSGQLNSDPHPTSQQPVSTQTLDIPLSSTSMIYVFKLLRNGEISWLNNDIDKYIYICKIPWFLEESEHSLCSWGGSHHRDSCAPPGVTTNASARVDWTHFVHHLYTHIHMYQSVLTKKIICI